MGRGLGENESVKFPKRESYFSKEGLGDRVCKGTEVREGEWQVYREWQAIAWWYWRGNMELDQKTPWKECRGVQTSSQRYEKQMEIKTRLGEIKLQGWSQESQLKVVTVNQIRNNDGFS